MKATWHQLSIKINWQMPTRFMTNFMKKCSLLHAQFTETMKVVENLLKKFVTNSFIKRICCKFTLEGNSNVQQQYTLSGHK